MLEIRRKSQNYCSHRNVLALLERAKKNITKSSNEPLVNYVVYKAGYS